MSRDPDELFEDLRKKDYVFEVVGGKRKSVLFPRFSFANKTRVADAEDFVQLTKDSRKYGNGALGLAIWIAEVGKWHAEPAIKVWNDESEKILSARSWSPFAQAVAYWGLWRAYSNSGDAIRAHQFKAKAEALTDELHESELEVYRGLVGADSSGFGETPPAAQAVANDGKPLPRAKEFAEHWTSPIVERSFRVGEIAHKFDDFVTHDAKFVSAAESIARLTKLQLQRGLSKPANYLLVLQPANFET